MEKEERRELLRLGRCLKPPSLPEHSARDLPFKNEIKLAPESICSFTSTVLTVNSAIVCVLWSVNPRVLQRTLVYHV